ncbi:hypothetical protein Prudu_020718, partial [Prunus dulcis]
MPRPGPRPYECVRRAWHSDRHQPMRGSIIQQIFRVVSEVHGSVTKKNKEWQEKLPMVVFKAEEIMYSKANSEAEYMNLETLWDRVNDAVNTIIRRDEGTETGELLPPCVEAALNLVAFQTTDERRPQFSQHHSGNQLNFAKASTGNSAHSVPESYSRINQNTNLNSCRNDAFSLENLPAGHNQLTTMSTNNSLDLGSVYPLYYGTHYQSEECQTACDRFESTSSLWNSEGEGRSLEATVRKRKAPFSSNEEDGKFCGQPDVFGEDPFVRARMLIERNDASRDSSHG